MNKEYKNLLVVSNSRSGSTNRLSMESIIEIENLTDSSIITQSRDSLTASFHDIKKADAVILGSSENFGYMSGAMKVFFENIYYEIIEEKRGMPFGLIIKAATSGIGAYNSILKITDALGWKEVVQPLIVVGDVNETHLENARIFGNTLAAGLELGVY